MNIIRLVAVNVIILLSMLIVVELIFGGWFFSSNNLNNLNILRSRLRIYDTSSLYDSEKPIIHCYRDSYGLRSNYPDSPELIKILTVGGSTTDQRYIDDSDTWQAILESELNNSGFDFPVANAGVDGQSTFGHIKNFELWFPYIPNLKPKYILFYIGINDFLLLEESGYDSLRNHKRLASYQESYAKNIVNKIKDYSAIYHLYRKIVGFYITYTIDVSHSSVDFSTRKYTRQGLLADSIYDQFDEVYIPLKSRLIELIEKSHSMHAQPIFITQPFRTYKWENDILYGRVDSIKIADKYWGNGVDHYYVFNRMNDAIIEVANENSVSVIELTNLKLWADEDFYDNNHMTPKGAKKVGLEISKGMVKLIKN